MEREIIIDGSEGEGGGQVLRTSLTLSAITGKPIRVENVRGKRKKPGLYRQHLTAFKAAAEICGARLEGAELGSSEIAFYPKAIKGGEYRFDIGSAGASTLVAQTILPILSHAKTPSTVTITGGTHNLWAPSFDFLNHAFLPQFRKMGGHASADLISHGFYPAGGGKIELDIQPVSSPQTFELTTRGDAVNEQAEIVLSNLKREIGERELKVLKKRLALSDDQTKIIHVDGPGPGNCVSVFLEFENITEVFVNLGQHGVRAETVANTIAQDVREYKLSPAAIGEHLADQLLLPMALMRGGRFTTTTLSQHTQTNIDIIKRFLDVDISAVQTERKCWAVEVKTPA